MNSLLAPNHWEGKGFGKTGVGFPFFLTGFLTPFGGSKGGQNDGQQAILHTSYAVMQKCMDGQSAMQKWIALQAERESRASEFEAAAKRRRRGKRDGTLRSVQTLGQ